MKTEKFHFGPKARQETAARLLGLKSSEVNAFPKSAPRLLGDPSYSFRAPLTFKRGGKVRELEIEVKFLKPSKKNPMKGDCMGSKPVKKAMGGILNDSDDKPCLKKGGMPKSMRTAKIMNLLGPKLKSAPSPAKKIHKSAHMHSPSPFKFLRDK